MFGVNEHSQNIQTYFLTVSREDFRSIYLFCFSNYLKGFFLYVQIRDYVLSLFCVRHSYLNVTRTSYVLWTYPNIPELRIYWIL